MATQKDWRQRNAEYFAKGGFASETGKLGDPSQTGKSVSQGHTGYDNADEFLGANYTSGHERALMRPETVAENARKAKLGSLRDSVRGYQGDVASIYDQLFADLDTLIEARKQDIDKNTGESLTKLTSQYTDSIPGIESSYAALGAGDSTDSTKAKIDAKTGYEDSTEEVGAQKEKDLTTLGEYGATSRANWGAERDALNRIFSRLDETDNEQDIVNSRNDVETQLGKAKASKASLMTDEGLKGSIAKGTDSTSRLGSIQDSLNKILAGSMSRGVKDAAVAAVGQSAGLTDEEKNQVKANSAY